jgi:RNA polymerase sigma-70 factor (ECF subfamily)
MALSRPRDLSKSADEELARHAHSESAAFEELYRRHVTRVYRYHLVRTGSAIEAQDLTTLTFLAALESMERYRGDKAFAAWLFGIARHKLTDYYRSRKPDEPLETAANVPSPDLQPEARAIVRLSLANLHQSILKLTPDRAEALVLRFFAGLSAVEAGQVMERSEAAVKMLVHRGLRDLKKSLGAAKEE